MVDGATYTSTIAFAQRMSLGYGGYQNPDDPLPPGPWDPIIRQAFDRARMRIDLDIFMPQPDPWKSLPSRTAFAVALAHVVVEKVGDLHMLAEGIGGEGRSNVQRFAGAFVGRFTDDFCGTPPRPIPWPFPGRRTFEPPELLVIAGQLDAAARFGGPGADASKGAANKFAEAGLRVT